MKGYNKSFAHLFLLLTNLNWQLLMNGLETIHLFITVIKNNNKTLRLIYLKCMSFDIVSNVIFAVFALLCK